MIAACPAPLLAAALALSCGAADERLPAGALGRLDPARLQGGGPVFALAFAPDGRTLASGSKDGIVRLWDAARGTERRRCRGHRGAVRAVALAGDGRMLASAGDDHTVRLWTAADGTERAKLAGHRAEVLAVAFSPDGKTVASAGRDGLLILWDVAAGKDRARVKAHRVAVSCLAFSPDGKVLASGGRDRVIRFWDPAAVKALGQVRAPGWVFAVAFSGDGKVLASGGQDQLVHLWDVARAQGLDQFGGYEGPVHAVALFADGKMAAAGSDDHGVRLWETATGKVRRRFAGHRGPVLAIALAPDGRTLASGGADGAVFLWHVAGSTNPGGRAVQDLSAREREALWVALGHGDPEHAYPAMCDLGAGTAGTVAFLKERLQAILEAQARAARLIADLDSDTFAVRRKAAAGLEKLGELAQPNLEHALRGTPSVETRRRIEQLLRKLRADEGDRPFAVRLQVLRVIEVLEHLGTPAARQLLARLAGALPDRFGRREARASLQRLARR